MNELSAFILYDGLPVKAGGAHKLSRKNIEDVYNSIDHFATRYTDCKIPLRVEVGMREFRWRSLFKYSLRFGVPGFNWWNYWAVKKDLVHWNISSEGLRKKMADITDEDHMVIGITWSFNFIDQVTGNVLPNQQHIPIIDERRPRSGIYLRLSSTVKTISVWFAFPFEELNTANLKYLGDVQENLPFRFSPKSWRIYKRSKNGNWFSRKMDIPVK